MVECPLVLARNRKQATERAEEVTDSLGMEPTVRKRWFPDEIERDGISVSGED